MNVGPYAEIEGESKRYLLYLDGKDGISQSPVALKKLSRSNRTP